MLQHIPAHRPSQALGGGPAGLPLALVEERSRTKSYAARMPLPSAAGHGVSISSGLHGGGDVVVVVRVAGQVQLRRHEPVAGRRQREVACRPRSRALAGSPPTWVLSVWNRSVAAAPVAFTAAVWVMVRSPSLALICFGPVERYPGASARACPPRSRCPALDCPETQLAVGDVQRLDDGPSRARHPRW